METALQSPPISLSSKGTPQFPVSAVLAVLYQELVKAVSAEAAVEGIALPQSAAELGRTPFEIDSLTAVEILCSIEPLVDFELKSSVVRVGGYTSIDDATTSLLPGIEKAWEKHHGVIQ